MERFAYVNLLVSEKYETQPAGIVHNPKVVTDADMRKQVIIQDKKRTIVEAVVMLIVLIGVIIVARRSWHKEDIDLNVSADDKHF